MATRRGLFHAPSTKQSRAYTIGGAWVTGDQIKFTRDNIDFELTIGALVTTAQVATSLKQAWNSETLTDTTATCTPVNFDGGSGTTGGARYGMVGGERDIPLTPDRAKRLRSLVQDPPSKFAGRKVVSVETIDGVKFDFDEDRWVVLRQSGTAPIIRCYAEAETAEAVETLLKKALGTVR